MKICLLYFLLISFVSLSENQSSCDTISNWQVYINNDLLKSFNIINDVRKIVLPKGEVKSGDTLKVVYSECSPCVDCHSILKLELKDNTTIKELTSPLRNNEFIILTTTLQMLSFNKKSNSIYFSHKTAENDKIYETFLFELEIK